MGKPHLNEIQPLNRHRLFSGMRLSDIKDEKLRARILEADREQNARAVGELPSAKRKQAAVFETKKSNGHEKAGSRSLVISFVCFRTRLCDDDNLQFGCKYLRDSIASTIGLDDGDARISWKYFQLKTDGPEGVCVMIQQTTNLIKECLGL